MTFTDIKSLYDLPTSGNTNEEQHYVPQSSPYEFVLERTPQVSSSALNLWVDVSTAQGYVEAWVWNDPDWDVLTLVDAAPANATQFALQCRDTHYVNSGRVQFHSSLAGELIKVSFDCYATPMDSPMFTEVHDHVQRLEEFIHLAPFSSSTYSGGRFDGTVGDDLNVYLSESHFQLDIPPLRQTYDGETIDFSSGDTEITFSLTDGYKNVAVYLSPVYSAGPGTYSLDVVISQGTEQASPDNVPDPPEIAGLRVFTIKARVISSVVQPITQAMITQAIAIQQKPAIFVLSFLYDGTLIVDEPLDRVNGPGFICTLIGVSIVGEVLGTSGSTIINIVQYDTDDQVGTDLFDADVDKPTLEYDDTIYVPQYSDMLQAEQDMLQVTATQSFQPFIQQVAGGTVQNVRVNMYFSY